MDSFLKYLEGDAWLNLLFLCLAIFSILLSAILYFRSKRERLPVYHKKSFNLIKNQIAKLKGLKVMFEDKVVNDLTLTQVAIWNRGRETINKEDVAPADPLRIIISLPHQILQAEIKYIRTPANNFSIEFDRDNGSVLIKFDYFHTNDGIAINIYHTGFSDEHIQLLGTIKGVERIRSATSERFRHTASFCRLLIDNGDSQFGIGLLGIGLLFLIALPVWLPLLFIDIVKLFIRRTPREFKLEEIK